jgi:4-hydroxybenzoate polyprenyltransferase
MFFARTWAMLVNRLADRRIDLANPRTAGRALPAGRLSARDGVVIALACAALFVGSASLFWVFYGNAWPPMLSVPVLAWIAFYSFTKRFTWLCHVFLGGALAASPVAAAIAVNPEALGSTPAIWWLAGMVLAWVAGFDVIYALQDMRFDREHGVHSVPAKLGWRGAAIVSRVLHLGAFAMLVLAWRADVRLAWLFGLGVVLVGALLLLEHLVLARKREAGLDMAFFTINGVVSCVLGVFGCADVLLG